MAKKKSRGAGPRAAGPKPVASANPTENVRSTAAAGSPKAGAPTPEVRREARAKPTARGPSGFFMGFEVPWQKLLAARVAIFLVLACDAVLQIGHAPRYGTGFNVAQLPGFDAIAPGTVAYEVGQLLTGYCLALAAFGVATRFVVPIAALLYGWLYFGSQVDGYQHHYLVFIMLVVASFVPWERPAGAVGDTPVRSWALRLFLVQLGIVYFWTAVAKLDGAWLDGSTLGRQMTGGLRSMVDSTIGIKAASVSVPLVELVLAGTVWFKRTSFIAAPLGILLHCGIVAMGLEIGLFAYLMLACYLLVIPDSLYRFIATDKPGPLAELMAKPSWRVAGAAMGIGFALFAFLRLEQARPVGIVAAVGYAAIVWRTWRTEGTPRIAIGLAHIAAMLLWIGIDRLGGVAIDYYRFKGSMEKRFGDKAVSEAAYARLVEIAPEDGNAHYQYAKVLLDANKGDAALVELRAAQRYEKTKARSFLLEARYLAGVGKVAEAKAAAIAGAQAEPSSSEARTLVETLSNAQAPTPPAPDEPDAP